MIISKTVLIIIYIFFPALTDHSEVYIACKPVSSEWTNLGTRLGVVKDALDTIEADHRWKGVETCMSEMLSVWLKRPQGKVTNGGIIPTWTILCDALTHIDRVLAERIAKDHDVTLPGKFFFSIDIEKLHGN